MPSLPRSAVVSALALAFGSGACGARSELIVPETDASAPRDAAGAPDVITPTDVPLRPPDCGASVPVGQIRARAMDIQARVAVDPAGNLYTARRVAQDWRAVSLDACLRERWTAPLPELARSTRVRAMVDPAGDVWFVGRGEPGCVRYHPDGSSNPVVPTWNGLLDTFVGVRREGPVLSTYITLEEKYLHVTEGDAERRVRLQSPSGFVFEHECGLFAASTVGCWNVAFSLAPAQLWIRDAELIDGTFRHVSPPAFDGQRLWTVRFGISTYDLVAIDLATGRPAVSTSLMHTARGQFGLQLGPPVVTADGDVAVYVHGSGQGEGALRVFRADGTERWRATAAWLQRGTQTDGAIFSDEATHLVGRGGVIYLAIGTTAYAFDARTGARAWTLADLGDVNESAVNLGENGDLYVRNADGVLFAIATASPGLEASPWPSPAGNQGLALAW